MLKLVEKVKSDVETRLDELVKLHVEIENELDARERRYKKRIAELVANHERVKTALQAAMNAAGLESARTNYGTVTISTHTTASCSDPDAFMAFVMEHGEFELLERRANMTACRDWLDEHGSLPPGVQLNPRRVLKVRAIS